MLMQIFSGNVSMQLDITCVKNISKLTTYLRVLFAANSGILVDNTYSHVLIPAKITGIHIIGSMVEKVYQINSTINVFSVQR